MKRKNKYFIAVAVLIISGCGTKNNDNYNQPVSDSLKNYSISSPDTSGIKKKNLTVDSARCPCQPSISMKELKKKVWKGDDLAYRQLYIANLSNRENQFFWAFYMANKYNYPKAYYDVFYCLKVSYKCDDYTLNNMDKKTKEFALEYLLLAADKGYEHAIDIINEYYPNLKKRIKNNKGK